MIESPFGPEVSFCALSLQEACAWKLLPQEATLLKASASPVRRSEFALGRATARAALVQLGLLDPPPILKGDGREPLWPADIVGSLSHTHDWAIAAVAYSYDIVALGIDLELVNPERHFDISKRICHESEVAWIDASPLDLALRTTMIFSAKESIFKAFYPICKRHIGFKDVELQFIEGTEYFEARLLTTLSQELKNGYRFKVGCREVDGFVFTFLQIAKF